ncbi:ABC transporter ATP-binding protein [Mesorhizobium sp. VK23B]|uniref:ABC transporter ATP-binding protein n=1 Tax=Mesorhizobium dulcispinae TaxID=3072316 RepID=A0ABU4X9E4_9HYPH|nr:MULTISPECIES: ABC transporter ATP-binding protein [unclassified Mesorhizobium]MDX8464692.1 ABC transporter ATP-binding protein [Mesorhizobium sp. VK23B]MDX8471078.1 ABC transporter ATP-binding protein [Mesorhizobium sp. VK23A]
MFRVVGATGGYGKTVIIRDVSIEVGDGEIVALLGRNGVGKSTLMRFATALIPAVSGHVEISGTRAPDAPAKRARMGLGYVPQGRFVFPRMTVRENIAVAAEANGHDGRKAVAAALSEFAILRPKADDLAGGLSGGQQQILALARALAVEPKVLLLDEPTEGVQPSIIDEMAGILKRINHERGLAILVAEQDLDFCLSIASRAYVMEKGRVRLETDRESLRADKRLQQELLGV